MPAELNAILIAFLVAIIGVPIGIFKLLPGLVKRRVEAAIEKSEQETKQKTIALEQQTLALKADIRQNNVMGEAVRQNGENLGAVVAHLGVMVKAMDSMRAEMHANAIAISGNTQTLGDFAESVDTLVNEGSIPLRKLSEKVDTGLQTLNLVVNKQNIITDGIDSIKEQVDVIVKRLPAQPPVTIHENDNGNKP